MLVFISWSGSRSKCVAEALSTWLSQVIQSLEPWISTDIEKGTRWSPEIADRLEKSKIGIICLTKDNLDARWILFEAGALSKTKDAYVCTFLLDIRPADVKHPLAQFQHTLFERNDVFSLLQTINKRVSVIGEKALSEGNLVEIFDTYWPRLQTKLQDILTQDVPTNGIVRSDNELLQEILEAIRGFERMQSKFENVLSDKIKDDYLRKILEQYILSLSSKTEMISSLSDYDKWIHSLECKNVSPNITIKDYDNIKKANITLNDYVEYILHKNRAVKNIKKKDTTNKDNKPENNNK